MNAATSDRIPELIWGSVGGVVLAGAALVLLVWPEGLQFVPLCGFKHVTGLPCPTCGGGCVVQRIVQSGRSTFYCPTHQR